MPLHGGAERVDGVRRRLGDHAALIVNDLVNIRWLTGFSGSNGVLVVEPHRLTLLTDGRYGVQAVDQTRAAGVDCRVEVAVTAADMVSALGAICGSIEGTSPIGVEAEHLPLATFDRWRAAIERPLVSTTGLVEEGRRCKDAREVETIERACAIADRALAEVAPQIVDGMTEADVRNRLEAAMRAHGADGPSYETIVAAGPERAALPHHRPTTAALHDGDTVIIDVGALVAGYHSDMTRTFVLGTPTAQQADLYELVLEAQRAGCAAVGPGVPASEIDAVCRGIITRAGFGDWFVHGTGHGVGLLIHEEPFVSRASAAVLRPGDVVTVEPGVYRGGFGGIRIEDLVLVTDDGCRLLTSSPKDSPCLPSPPTT